MKSNILFLSKLLLLIISISIGVNTLTRNNAQLLFGDAIYLKNGNTIEGRIVSADEKEVVLEIGYGTITIKRSQIQEVVAEEWSPPKPPKIPVPEKPISTIENTKAITPINTSGMQSFLESKALNNKHHREINKILLKLLDSTEDNELWQIFDELVAKSADDTDYLLTILTGLKNFPPTIDKTSAISVMRWLIMALGKHQSSLAIKAFTEILAANEDILKMAVLTAFNNMKNVSTAHLIRSQLPKEKSPAIKTAMINHLFTAEDKESLLMFLDYLEDADNNVREASANAVVGLSQKMTADELKTLDLIGQLRNRAVITKQKETRQQIISVLGQLKNTDALETLMTFLTDENAEIRSEAAVALGSIGDKKATAFMVERLQKEEDMWTRMQIIGALQKTNDPTAIPALIESLRDGEEKVRLCAARALRNITPHSFGADYDKWKQWWEKEQSAKPK